MQQLIVRNINVLGLRDHPNS